MGKFHFFTDYDLLNVQTTNQEFGPAGISGSDDQYRITSLHTAISAPKAYAVCDGTICVQMDKADPALVNIVLKPIQQPALNFVPVQYYIYKGIKLDSLINSSTMEISSTSTIELAVLIRDAQIAWNNTFDVAMGNPPATTVDLASANSLGIHYTAMASSPNQVLDTDPIDILFYRDIVDYQMPNVKAGMSIGIFKEALFGFEVLVENLYVEHKVDLIRNFENYIKVPILPGSPTDAQIFEHWNDKESILNYLDPCAFFGSLYASEIKGFHSVNGVSSFSIDTIYSTLLGSFTNKNKTYIDIRNEHNLSLDYYQNYGRDIEISFIQNSSFATLDYYNNNWPILILDQTSFPTANTTEYQLIVLKLPNGAIDANPIEISTVVAHGLNTNDLVSINSVGGNIAANVELRPVTVLTANTFSLNNINGIGSGAYTAGTGLFFRCKVNPGIEDVMDYRMSIFDNRELKKVWTPIIDDNGRRVGDRYGFFSLYVNNNIFSESNFLPASPTLNAQFVRNMDNLITGNINRFRRISQFPLTPNILDDNRLNNIGYFSTDGRLREVWNHQRPVTQANPLINPSSPPTEFEDNSDNYSTPLPAPIGTVTGTWSQNPDDPAGNQKYWYFNGRRFIYLIYYNRIEFVVIP